MKWTVTLALFLAAIILLLPFATWADGTCQDPWLLPSDPIKLTLVYPPVKPGSLGTFGDVTLSEVPAGYSIQNGTWKGWCADETVGIYISTSYTVRAYSSFDPDLATKCPSCTDEGEQWDKVNYILNHKVQGATWEDIQAAIWHFTDKDTARAWEYNNWSKTDAFKDMIADADANGAGFCPVPGQVGAVLLRTDVTAQLLFIEVPIPSGFGTGTPGYWKNHPDAWPVDSITIGGETYTKEDVISWLQTSEGNNEKADKTLTIFRALVAAKLNVLVGNASSCIDDTITAADAWMGEYGPVGSGVLASTEAWEIGEPLYLMLDDYNNGRLCAPARD